MSCHGCYNLQARLEQIRSCLLINTILPGGGVKEPTLLCACNRQNAFVFPSYHAFVLFHDNDKVVCVIFVRRQAGVDNRENCKIQSRH